MVISGHHTARHGQCLQHIIIFGQFLFEEALKGRWLACPLLVKETLSWLIIGQFDVSSPTSGMFPRSGNSPESIFSPELTILTNISHGESPSHSARGTRSPRGGAGVTYLKLHNLAKHQKYRTDKWYIDWAILQ